MAQFGPRVCATVTGLRIQARQSVAQTKIMMATLFGLTMSTGSVSNIDRRASKVLDAPYKELHDLVKGAHVANLDETTWYLEGARYVLWCATIAKAAFLMLRPNRGQKEAKELIGKDFKGVVVSDRYCAYHWIDGKRRQMCWAHLLRDFIGISMAPKPIGLSGWILQHDAKKVLRGWGQVRDGTLERGDYVEQMSKVRKRMKVQLGQTAMDGGRTRWGGMAREILKHFESLWTFLDVEGVEPTNNSAERTLRHAVILRKLCFGSQSLRGLRFMERALSVYETIRRQGRCFITYMQSLFENKPLPILATP